jgi:hypothetical protein
MSTERDEKDLMHFIKAKFYPATLPLAKKPYNLRVESQRELGISDIASKASAYNFTTPAKVIEEGLAEGLQLIKYLVADGYRITTPLFNLSVRVPGEFDGTETHLPAGKHAKGRLNLTAPFREYLNEHVSIEINGKEDNSGFIADVIDEFDGAVDETLHGGFPFEIHGTGLKISADAEHAHEVGLFLEDEFGMRFLFDSRQITTNEPHLIKANFPANHNPGNRIYLVIRTQSSAKSSGNLLKDVREMKTDFSLLFVPLNEEQSQNQDSEKSSNPITKPD